MRGTARSPPGPGGLGWTQLHGPPDGGCAGGPGWGVSAPQDTRGVTNCPRPSRGPERESGLFLSLNVTTARPGDEGTGQVCAVKEAGTWREGQAAEGQPRTRGRGDCTFLFLKAPLAPGTASHTRLMASLQGTGRESHGVTGPGDGTGSRPQRKETRSPAATRARLSMRT